MAAASRPPTSASRYRTWRVRQKTVEGGRAATPGGSHARSYSRSRSERPPHHHAVHPGRSIGPGLGCLCTGNDAKPLAGEEVSAAASHRRRPPPCSKRVNPSTRKRAAKAARSSYTSSSASGRDVVGHGDVRVVREPHLPPQRFRGADAAGQLLALADAGGHRDEHHLGHRPEGAGPAQVQLVRRVRGGHLGQVSSISGSAAAVDLGRAEQGQVGRDQRPAGHRPRRGAGRAGSPRARGCRPRRRSTVHRRRRQPRPEPRSPRHCPLRHPTQSGPGRHCRDALRRRRAGAKKPTRSYTLTQGDRRDGPGLLGADREQLVQLRRVVQVRRGCAPGSAARTRPPPRPGPSSDRRSPCPRTPRPGPRWCARSARSRSSAGWRRPASPPGRR